MFKSGTFSEIHWRER